MNPITSYTDRVELSELAATLVLKASSAIRRANPGMPMWKRGDEAQKLVSELIKEVCSIP
jgi:hypothetical protein